MDISNEKLLAEFPGGVITATLTPLNTDYSIDHNLLFDHCRSLIDRGGDGIALLGTTGEANSFSAIEREVILENLLERGFEAKRLIVGTGTCSLTETASLTRHAIRMGVGGVLLMPPFYYRKVTEDGLFRYFASLIDLVASDDLRIFLYHFPRMSGIDMSVDFAARLKAEFPKVIAGYKDSSGDLQHMLDVMKAAPELKFYAGTERYLTDVVRNGGAGCISATTNYKVEAAAEVYRALQTGEDYSKQEELMISYRESFEGHNFSAALKGVLAKEQNRDSWNILRPPLSSVEEGDIEAIMGQLH